MGLPSKDDIENIQWQKWYDHFNQRLRERYGICVSFEEYRHLCRQSVETIKKQTKNKKIGYIEIHGKTVKVAKEIKRKKALITALT